MPGRPVGFSKSTNDGGGWGPANDGLTTLEVNQASGYDGQHRLCRSNRRWRVQEHQRSAFGPVKRRPLIIFNVNAVAVLKTPLTLYAGPAPGVPGVFKSIDGGANWTSFSNGLPSRAD